MCSLVRLAATKTFPLGSQPDSMSNVPKSLCVRKAGIFKLGSSSCSFVDLALLLTTAATGSPSKLAAGEQLLARFPPRSRRNGDIREGKPGDLLILGAAASSPSMCAVLLVASRSTEVSRAGDFGLRRSLCMGILSMSCGKYMERLTRDLGRWGIGGPPGE